MVPGGTGGSGGRRPAGYFVFRAAARTTTRRGWASARCPSSTTATQALRDAMYAGDRTPSCAAGCGRPSRPTAGGSTSRTCSAGSGPTSSGPEVARGIRAGGQGREPDAYLLGEHSYDATDQLAGDQWDGVMNYAGLPARRSSAGSTGSSFGAMASGSILRAGRASTRRPGRDARRVPGRRSPWAVARCQYNLLDSHDTRAYPDVGRRRPGPRPGGLRAAADLRRRAVDPVRRRGRPRGPRRPQHATDDALGPGCWDLDRLAFVRTLVRHRVGSRRPAGRRVPGPRGRGRLASRSCATPTRAGHRRRRREGPAPRPAGPLGVAHGAIPDGDRFTEALTGAAGGRQRRSSWRFRRWPRGSRSGRRRAGSR